MLVETRVGAEVGLSAPPEVKDTPRYRDVRDTIKSAAIRLPSECSRDTAAQASGASRNTDVVLRTLCGVWLAEIERALSTSGYRVVSWDALSGLEKQKNLSPYAAAKELGADMVFVFNSLEASSVRAGSEGGLSIKYFFSDARGTAGQPMTIPDAERAPLREFVKQRGQLSIEEAKQRVTALSATLDATAILPDGESIWFYRSTVTRPVASRTGMRFLFEHEVSTGADGSTSASLWYPTTPEGLERPAEAPKRPTSAAEDVETAQTTASASDEYARDKQELIRDAAADFVGRYKGTKK